MLVVLFSGNITEDALIRFIYIILSYLTKRVIVIIIFECFTYLFIYVSNTSILCLALHKPNK